MRDTQKWLQSHTLRKTNSTSDTINNLVFAKEFFHIVDTDVNGAIKMEDLLTAMVSLGVTTDS